MTNTPKLNLPLIESNMTADVVRDMNALANAVDELAGANNGLAKLDGNSLLPLTNIPKASTTQQGVLQLIDSYTSSDKTKAPTANALLLLSQAAQLVKLTDDQGQFKDISGTDLNNLDKTGFYVGNNLINAPNSANYYFVFHMKWNSGVLYQMIFRNSPTNFNEIFVRYKGASWTQWVLLATGDKAQMFKLTQDSGNAIDLGTGTDIKTITQSGLYVGSQFVNAPESSTKYFRIFVNASSSTSRFYLAVSSDNIFYFATMNANVWSDWVKVATTDVAQMSKITADSGTYKYFLNNSTDDVYATISSLPIGMHTLYVNGTVQNAPNAKTIRLLVHKTDVTIGWIIGITYQGDMYTNYQTSANNFLGWQKIANTDLGTTSAPGLLQLVDSIASTDKTKAATANSVKMAVDWAKSFGLGDTATDISGTNLNNLDLTGFYSGSNLTNSPNTGAYYFVINVKWNATTRYQILYRNSPTAYTESWVRIQNGGTWNAWVQQAMLTDLTDGSGWKTPTLTSGYTKGSATEPCRYKKVGNFLMLEITAYGTAYGTANPIFTLPVGMRPDYQIFPTFTLIGNYNVVRGSIDVDGTVSISTTAANMSGATGVMMHCIVPLS